MLPGQEATLHSTLDSSEYFKANTSLKIDNKIITQLETVAKDQCSILNFNDHTLNTAHSLHLNSINDIQKLYTDYPTISNDQELSNIVQNIITNTNKTKSMLENLGQNQANLSVLASHSLGTMTTLRRDSVMMSLDTRVKPETITKMRHAPLTGKDLIAPDLLEECRTQVSNALDKGYYRIRRNASAYTAPATYGGFTGKRRAKFDTVKEKSQI